MVWIFMGRKSGFNLTVALWRKVFFFQFYVYLLILYSTQCLVCEMIVLSSECLWWSFMKCKKRHKFAFQLGTTKNLITIMNTTFFFRFFSFLFLTKFVFNNNLIWTQKEKHQDCFQMIEEVFWAMPMKLPLLIFQLTLFTSTL